MVEAVFFRRAPRAESYLRRAAAALPYATDEDRPSPRACPGPGRRAGTVAAALYRRAGDGALRRRCDLGAKRWSRRPASTPTICWCGCCCPARKSVWLDELRAYLDPENAAIYVLAVPVTVRHELVSFTLYGAHRNGAQLDPEEVELLEDAGARSVPRVRSRRSRARTGALRAIARAASRRVGHVGVLRQAQDDISFDKLRMTRGYASFDRLRMTFPSTSSG